MSKTHRTVRLITMRCMVSIVAGAAITIAVAMACVANANWRGYVVISSLPGRVRWPCRVPPHWPSEARVSSVRFSVGFKAVHATTFATHQPGGMWNWMSIDQQRSGWPASALYAFERQEPGPSATYPVTVTGFRIAGGDSLRIPTLPLWPGFALDTAFYAILAFLLRSAPRFVRRTRRRRRGLCVACGYELKGMQKCPECGF